MSATAQGLATRRTAFFRFARQVVYGCISLVEADMRLTLENIGFFAFWGSGIDVDDGCG